MLQGFADIFAILAVIVVIVILYYYPRIPRQDWALRLALGLQLGGALGNLIDRLRYQGHVTDFISVATFPVFNIADASISIGVAILILSVWFTEKGKPSTNSAGNSVPEDVTGE
jgi:signal peptidase II